ncbi:hypothetical protein [Pseudoclavibacter sp. JSM 162008]|uniref:hypothetical protein n=1 Tax=Pseudoclavibacter sp. JSM 162008 TaxID=3229855 RepID=UPI0035252251
MNWQRMQEVFPLEGGSAEESFANPGGGTFTLPIGANAMDLTYGQGRDLTTPWSRWIVQGTEEHIEYAGLITGRRWNEDAEAWTIRAYEASELFKKRFPHYVGEYGTEQATITIVNKSARHVISMLIDLGANRNRVRWDLRLTAGITESGGISEVIEREKMQKLAHTLSRFEARADGPNWHLKPKWHADGGLMHERRIGNPYLNQGTFDFDLDAAECPLTVGDYEEEARDQATGMMVQADGIGAGKIVQQIVESDLADNNAGYDGFYLDEELRDDATDGSLAFARGLAELTAKQRPIQSMPMTLTLRRDGTDPPVDPGSRIVVRTARSRGIPPRSVWYVTTLKYRTGSDDAQIEAVPFAPAGWIGA